MMNDKLHITYSRKSLGGQFGSESVEIPPLSSNLAIDLSSDTVEIDSLLQSSRFIIHNYIYPSKHIHIQRFCIN